jgi:hypothetical protein
MRGYVISGKLDRLARAREFLGRSTNPLPTLRALSEAIPDQTQQVELLGALIREEFDWLTALIEIHREKGVSAAMRTISATAGAGKIPRIQLLTADLLAAGNARLARRTEQSKRSSDVSVVTAAVATLFNLGLLGVVILLVRREIKDRKQAEEVVKFAEHDSPTGLPNRVPLGERWNRALAAAKSERQGIAILFIDLDRFKNINDSLGHQAGDHLLQNIGRRLAQLRAQVGYGCAAGR